ncbi:MAG: hypothetical protein E7Z70_04375 [Thermoplasmata archaeon]|nr:hypothetical protein [Thermoplasmata archaeon]
MSEKTEKSIIFLEDGFVLTDKEEELIEKCSENEIIILTYSRIDDKKVDVERVRRKCGKSTEYEEVRESTSIVGLIDGWNKEYDLHIDVTFAAPYHAMELTPFGYLEGNRVTAMVDGELRSTGQRYIDYSVLKDTELEVVQELMSEQRCTVNDIDEIWINRKRKAKKTVKRDEYEGKPDFTKTLHRTVNKLTKMDYISKEEGHPAKYYMNENQRFMYRLTVKRDV